MSLNRRDVLLGGSTIAGAVVGSVSTGAGSAFAQAPQLPDNWQREADVVVIGAGAMGLSCAVRARDAGASVIVVEAEKDIGGHAIVSGGHVALGGGTSAQKKHGIEDSPDLLFRDLTDWTVVEPNGFPDFRYNDREIIRAFADNAAGAYDFLVAHGVVFVDKAPNAAGGIATGNSAPRENHAAIMEWSLAYTGLPVDPSVRATHSSGAGVVRPLEATARKLGVDILLSSRMSAIYRQSGGARRVVGIAVDNNGAATTIRARKAVVIATGGSTGNVNFRRMFDPRLTEEYCGLLGGPWSNQDASGELAAMAVGASLWGFANQTGEFGMALIKSAMIGSQHAYQNAIFVPSSPVFDRARAIGLEVTDYQNVILVNMLGKRFYDETAKGFTANDYKSIAPYTQGSYRNVESIKYHPNNWMNAALAGIGDGHNGGGPIWAIFDADAVAREGWHTEPPHVDIAAGMFFTAGTLSELAAKIVMKYQRVPMPPPNLEDTVARYNSFVDKGVDDDFGKPKPLYKIAKPPFFAAWATPMMHDTRTGLRINGACQVMDMNGDMIGGLYCGGESAGGFSLHGLARATCQGYIVGAKAAAEASAI